MNALTFDFRNPDYLPVFQERAKRLAWLREDPLRFEPLKSYYRDNPADFVNEWGMTFDPRLVSAGRPATVPFLLMPRQREWIEWAVDHWRNDQHGLTEKSRDCGVSWLAIALASTLCLFHDGVVIGFGSRKEEYVDKLDGPKSLFFKARMFLQYLPSEFLGGWDAKKHAPYMRIKFPETGSYMTGEAGDGIGRGDRTALYFVDEAAHLERPALVDASLSATTNCRIDISSVNGSANPFAEKRHRMKSEDVFTFHWRAQPLDAGILTPSGWRKMGDMRVGDEVIGSDGLPRPVLAITPQSEKEVYRVEFSDGSSTECCDDHLWEVIKPGNHRAERRHIRHVLSLREIRAEYFAVDSRGFKRNFYQIPVTRPVEFNPVTLPLDPYVLGCLLGDGSFPVNSVRPICLSLSQTDAEIADLVNTRLPQGCSVKFDGSLTYRIASDGRHRRGKRGWNNPVVSVIHSLGLSGKQSHDKFIPADYLLSSREDRLALLQGLMDTDGCVVKASPGSARYATVSANLASGVQQLAESLGGTAAIYESPAQVRNFPGGRSHECRKRYTVNVKLPSDMVPFKMERKAAAYQPTEKYPPRRAITNIELVGIKTVQCLSVQDSLYLTDRFIVTHNCDPRKDEAWYAKQCEDLDPVTVAQEIDIDYNASAEGKLIPAIWINAAIDAHVKLGVTPSGSSECALDIADEGRDKCALAGGQGILLDYLEEWSGKDSDTFATVQKAADRYLNQDYTLMRYDADGMGALVRGDIRVINEQRAERKLKPITVVAFRGSGEVYRPESQDVKGRLNKDYFANRKAQAWFHLRRLFLNTYRAVVEEKEYDPSAIISIAGDLPTLSKLVMELGQPTYSLNLTGKIIIDKAPDGVKSPNLADAVMMRYAPIVRPMVISDEALKK